MPRRSSFGYGGYGRYKRRFDCWQNIAAFRRPLAYQRIAEEVNPCKATERILQALSRYFYEEVVPDAFISSATEKVN